MKNDANLDRKWDATQGRIAELLLESRAASTFSDVQRRELNELLRDSDQNREFATQFLLDGESLTGLLATREMAAITAGQRSESAVIGDTKHARQKVSRWFAGIAAAVLAGAVLYFTISTVQEPVAVVQDPIAIVSEPVAVVQDEVNAVFAEDAAPVDGKFERKSYSLTSGMVAILFRNGVSTTVKAPAKFEIVDEFRMKLTCGQVRTLTPETGRGFTIATPRAEIEDLGTEFGVAVDAETGESAVHVFDGEVEVRNLDGGKAVTSLRFGDSVRIRNGKVNPGKSPEPGRFPTLADVAYSRWKHVSDALRMDPDLVFYYAFTSSAEDDRLLRDEAVEGLAVDGRIVGARWVTGRWPGKWGLLFDRKGDAVELEIPGELRQFTFAAWVNVDRLDNARISVLNSLGWEPGDVHLQISRSRRTFCTGLGERSKRSYTEVRLPLGRWVHLAAVVDVDERTATTWIDGEVAVRAVLPAGLKLNPGACLLGSWSNKPQQRSREFRGRMDEVVLWRRALSQDEIRRLVTAGSPTPQTRHSTQAQ